MNLTEMEAKVGGTQRLRIQEANGPRCGKPRMVIRGVLQPP
jgi:hypothetical protein